MGPGRAHHRGSVVAIIVSRRRRRLLGLLVSAAAVLALAHTASAPAICVNYPNCGTHQTVDPPTITSIAPEAGSRAGGTQVSIGIRGFTINQLHPPRVLFGSTPATKVVAHGSSALIATAPSHAAGTVDVRVYYPFVTGQYPGGLTPTSASDQFTYCPGLCVPPIVTSITPSSGAVTGGQLVTLTGTNLGDVTRVLVGTTSVTTFCASSANQIQFNVPPAAGDRSGPVNVTVVTREGASAPITYTYTPAPPPPGHLDDNRSRFTLASLLHLNFLPSFLTDLLPGIGGRVMQNPALHVLYWDSNWNADNPTTPESAINTSLRNLVSSGYLGDAAQYGVGTPSMTGSDGPSALCFKSSARGGVNLITLLAWITCEAGGGPQADTEIPGTGGIEGLPLLDGLPMADDNTVYAILLPTDSSVGLFGINSCSSFDAFHFFTVVAQIRIGWAWFIPYPDPTWQSVPFIVAPMDCAGGLTGVTENVSHELVESATDPLVGLGWIDNSKFSFSNLSQIFMQGEASDLCENTRQAHSSIGGVSVSTYWSNSQQQCVPAQAACSTSVPQLNFRPTTSLLAVRPHPLFASSVKTLGRQRTYEVNATMSSTPAAVAQPAVSSHYTVWQQPGRFSFSGSTKVGSGPVTRFAIVQVGHKRCERSSSQLGAKGWHCQTGQAPLDAGSIVNELFTRDFTSSTTSSGSGGVVRTKALQGTVAFSALLHRTRAGAPVQLSDVARVGSRVKARQTVSFDYTHAGRTRITLPK